MTTSSLTRNQTPRWGTIETGAEHLGVHPRTLRRMIAEGDLPGYRVGPRLIRIDLNDIDALLRPIPTAGGVAC